MPGSTNPSLDPPTLVTRAAEPRSANNTDGSLPPFLLEQGVRRLGVVSLTAGIVATVGWLTPQVIRGRLLEELSTPKDAVPAGLAIIASFAMFALTRTRIRQASLARFGLIYQVVASYGIAASQYWGTFGGVEAHAMIFDRVGLTIVALWMILFTVLVPNRPTYALVALLGSASSIPLVYGLSVAAGDAPSLPAGRFIEIFVIPYLLTTAVAYFAARSLYRLGTDLRRATEMGAYKLETMLGRGGMGEVWRARHRLPARPAAIKLIRPDAVRGADPTQVHSLLNRFEREAQVTATLGSPHTVELYDFGISEEGTFYYVMELLDGTDLQTLVNEHGPLPAERAIYLLRQACLSLAEAHSRGLVHRDIKPANIFTGRQGLEYDFVKVLDFGLVAPQQRDPSDAGLTVDGTLPGTPAYIAPEMAEGDVVDFRADIYSLGCVAYWLLTGRLVFDEGSPMKMVIAHATQIPDPPSAATELEIPAALESVVMRCLEKSPTKRPASAVALADALDACELKEPWTESRAQQWWAHNHTVERC